mmetsp:Transcript_21584/g.51159  ORF Transcript_21584/g.51159 Transcript_21584/m.51159 type:complete len:251 (-) Transcript_21584:430-1182(-)
MLAEEAHRAVPGQLGPGGVVLGLRDAARALGGLVGEGMVGQVAMPLVAHAGLGQLGLQAVDAADREELVLRGPVGLQRDADLAGVHELQRRHAVPDHGRVGLGHQHRRQQRQRAAHAVAGHADLAAAEAQALQVLHRAAHILRGRLAEVQARHQVVGLLGLDGALPAVEVRHQGREAGAGEALGHAADLVVQAPPLLDHDDRPHGLLGLGEVAGQGGAVGAPEFEGLGHGHLHSLGPEVCPFRPGFSRVG